MQLQLIFYLKLVVLAIEILKSDRNQDKSLNQANNEKLIS